MKFPDGASVYAWFAPAHWERFAGPIDGRVAVRPCPTLQDVATLYHDADLPRAIVRNAISGLASLSSASFNVSQQAVELAVGQFMGRYARRCTLYQLMTYAANYADYKRSLSSFDLNDVTTGFQRFTQKWQPTGPSSRTHPETIPKARPKAAGSSRWPATSDGPPRSTRSTSMASAGIATS